MPPSPAMLLPDVIAAALEAGQAVAAEFSRPGGPRLIDHVTAPVDHEIELRLRERLVGLLPARFVGEEAGVLAAEANGFCWVVDPHDGTRAFLEGKRGSSVSIALLRQGRPVIAVVFAPLSPDRGPDMIAWAEGGPITRNGQAVEIDISRRQLATSDVVFLNHGVWQRPVWNSIACAPARFMPLPSIAYRLARIAVGDGIATQTLRPVNALDIAAGHALLMAAGGVLLAEDGAPVTYNELGESRPSACFGGAPAVVDTLLRRAWRGSTEARREPRVTLDWPRAAEPVAFDRAAGALLGLAIGDHLALRTLGDGGPPLLDGQGGADTEAAVMLARHLVASGDAEEAGGMAAWRLTHPPVEPADLLARAVPIAIRAGDPQRAAAWARRDALATGADADGAAAFAGAIAAGISGADVTGMLAAAGPVTSGSPAIRTALASLAKGQLPDPHPRGGLATALIGAARGRMAFPVTHVMAVLTCRPDAGLADAGLDVPRPRPDIVWTDDLIDLAEALLPRQETEKP